MATVLGSVVDIDEVDIDGVGRERKTLTFVSVHITRPHFTWVRQCVCVSVWGGGAHMSAGLTCQWGAGEPGTPISAGD